MRKGVSRSHSTNLPVARGESNCIPFLNGSSDAQTLRVNLQQSTGDTTSPITITVDGGVTTSDDRGLRVFRACLR